MFWSYGLGDVGTGMGAALIGFYLLRFYVAAGLPPWLAGLAYGVGRLWDAVNDPIVGWLSDKTSNHPWGPRIPWMLWSAVPLGIAMGAIWWLPPWPSVTVKFVIFLAIWQVLQTDAGRPQAVAFSDFIAQVKAKAEEPHVEEVTVKDRTYEFKVVKLNPERQNVVLSRRELVEAELRKRIVAAHQLFEHAYRAKGRMPAERDRAPTAAESMAWFIRNDQWPFTAEARAARHWPLFPLDAPWPTLMMLAADDQRYLTWQHWLTAAGIDGVDTRGGYEFDLLDHAIRAAVDGLGITIADRHMVAREIAAGVRRGCGGGFAEIARGFCSRFHFRGRA